MSKKFKHSKVKSNDSKVMTLPLNIVNPIAAGLDVHKDSIVATVISYIVEDNTYKQETRTFSAFTDDLQELKKFLTDNNAMEVVMESTGVYWKPVFKIIKDSCNVTLCNAKNVKYLPGKKTDVKDSEWLATLHCYGLIKGSYIPKKEIIDLRDLTRHRAKLKQTIAAEKNRVHKLLQSCNIKLSSVASDIFGASGLQMITALVNDIEHSNPEAIAQMAKGTLRNKIPDLEKALDGSIDKVKAIHIQASLELIASLLETLAKIQTQIDEGSKHNFSQEMEIIDSLPSVNKELAQTILAEVGDDMSVFPTVEHFTSWGCVAPSSNTSAGKKKVQESHKDTNS